MFLNSTTRKYSAGSRTALEAESEGFQPLLDAVIPDESLEHHDVFPESSLPDPLSLSDSHSTTEDDSPAKEDSFMSAMSPTASEASEEADDASLQSSPPDSPRSSHSGSGDPMTEYITSATPVWDRTKRPMKSIMKTTASSLTPAIEIERYMFAKPRANASRNKALEAAEHHPRIELSVRRPFSPTPRIDPEDRDLRMAQCRPGSPSILVIEAEVERKGRRTLLQAPVHNLEKPPVAKSRQLDETPTLDEFHSALLMYRHSNVDICDPEQRERVSAINRSLELAGELKLDYFYSTRIRVLDEVPYSHLLSPYWLAKFGLSDKGMPRPSPPPSPPLDYYHGRDRRTE